MNNLDKLLNEVNGNIEIEMSNGLECDDFNRAFNDFNTKERIWLFLIYPDNEDMLKFYEYISRELPTISICHDRDKLKNGEDAKPHIHCIVYLPNAVYISHFKHLDEPPAYDYERYCRPRKNIRVQVRYLLHLDSPSKYQYSMDMLKGSLVDEFSKYLDKDLMESNQVCALITAIEELKFESVADMLRFACNNNLYAVYRRNAYTFNLILCQTKDKKYNANKKKELE